MIFGLIQAIFQEIAVGDKLVEGAFLNLKITQCTFNFAHLFCKKNSHSFIKIACSEPRAYELDAIRFKCFKNCPRIQS